MLTCISELQHKMLSAQPCHKFQGSVPCRYERRYERSSQIWGLKRCPQTTMLKAGEAAASCALHEQLIPSQFRRWQTHNAHDANITLLLPHAMRVRVSTVPCSFWNFDALFQPQQHPARDAHDTFFLTSARAPRPAHAFTLLSRTPQCEHSSGQQCISSGASRMLTPGDEADTALCNAEPASSRLDRQPQDYVHRVRSIHERGGFGSTG